jgi:hypothetical protein
MLVLIQGSLFSKNRDKRVKVLDNMGNFSLAEQLLLLKLLAN